MPALVRLGLPAVAVVFAGAIALQLSLPADAPPATSAMTSVHKWWYLGRASGFVAFGLLLASVLLGLGISSRVFDGLLMRPWVFDMHQFLSIFVLVAMLFHALILLPDPYAHFSFVELMVPFASPYRPVAVGLGAIVLYGSVAVTLSSYAKQWIGQQGWRFVHYASFALFAGALAHGVLAGADSHEAWAQVAYLVGGLAVVFFTFFRILAARSIARPKPAATVPATAARGRQASS
jgi:predicted ferric reductase